MRPPRVDVYWNFFEVAGDRYKIDPAVIASICENESRCGEALTPPGPGGTGDYGHGRGLMQCDDRYHGPFIATGLWKDPLFNILYGARLLSLNLHYFSGDMRLAVPAYNCGCGNVDKALSEGRDPDYYTAHRNYSKRVFDTIGSWEQ